MLGRRFAKASKVASEDEPRLKDDLAAYVSGEVDPILRPCIAKLLVDMPSDVVSAMHEYFLTQSGQQSNGGSTEDSSQRQPRLSPVDFLAKELKPLLWKIMRALSIHKPKNVLEFLCREFPKFAQAEFSLSETMPWDIPLEWLPRLDAQRPSTTGGTYAGRANNRSMFFSPVRPRTAAEILRVPQFKSDAKTKKRILPGLFLGGRLTFQVLFAEKFSGSGLVFGSGKRVSMLRVACGNTTVTEVAVTQGCVSDSFQWSGYECAIGDMDIHPSYKASTVEIIIFDSERADPKVPFGVARLDLAPIEEMSDFECTLPILPLSSSAEKESHSEGFDKLSLYQDDSLGLLQLKVQFDPYKHFEMAVDQEYHVDITHMSTVSFGLGWSTDGSSASLKRLRSEFGAALMMFDAAGMFLDAVDGLQPMNRRGPPTRHRRLTGDGVSGDMEEIAVHLKHSSRTFDSNKTVIYFIVLFARDAQSHLGELKHIYLRLLDGVTKVPYGYYAVPTAKGASCCIMARAWRNPSNNHVRRTSLLYSSCIYLL
jgi:hypothetical protein